MSDATPPHALRTPRASARGRVHRLLFFNSVIALTLAATWVLADIFWRGGMTRIEGAMLALFVPLFAMVALGFVQALTGFVLLLRNGGGPFSLRLQKAADPAELPVTAIVMPIHNEDVARVYEAVRAMYLSLLRARYGGKFHFFILSDTRIPNIAAEEQSAWLDLCKQVRGFGQIFYRRRRIPLNRKSGNVSDFCRRWGRSYKYMIVLDADSIMDGQTLGKLVALMEAHPRVGILQTAPRLALAATPFARLMQFSSALYGPLFAAGLNGWQQGEGNYWGHNAILRVEPFMEHCALPELPLTGGREARFLSHDYVEAALMRKAGYEVRLAIDLEGSFEGGPPTLLAHAQRDRRWCRGNLQHAWLLTAPGLHPVNRLHLLLGVLSYLASPLWLVMLIFGLAQSLVDVTLSASRSFDYDIGLSSFLDVGGFRLALGLFVATMGMIVAPKFLAGLLALVRKQTRITFGGGVPLLGSLLVEQVFSTLLAPVLMLFNTRSVLSILMGRKVGWAAQRRDETSGTSWGWAARTHGFHTLAGFAFAAAGFFIHPAVGWWLTPVWLGLVLSIPLSVLLDSPFVGGLFTQLHLFTTPVENAPPPVIKHLQRNLEMSRRHVVPAPASDPDQWLAQLVLDPYINAAHRILHPRRATEDRARRDYFLRLEQRLIQSGPSALSEREKRALLLSSETITRLHAAIWRTPPGALAPWWRAALQRYNLLTDRPAPTLAR
ncbi:MAG TPA: glucans biosynthesis glucosyltransferase MdoH [Kiritimatiellia bacterium]|nr:glucans biosynthesis glucosyltransferase MdoH [Kiritimatiellia bacterium]